jgi:hypothetical protein
MLQLLLVVAVEVEEVVLNYNVMEVPVARV